MEEPKLESKNNICNSIFWIETEKIKPNPFQPRREFDEGALKDLADSIRQYGILQPLVVVRREVEHSDGGLSTEYELISGERRLRASKLAGLPQVPVVIRTGDDSDRMKLELAIIENLQREDLNPVDRAVAFQKLVVDFKFKHIEVAAKVGKSREYVSNSIRILALPKDILDAMVERKITEGHTRPLLMLCDKPEEQKTLFKEIIYKRLTVREAESISRHIATEKVRRRDYVSDPEILDMESKLSEKLGTRVHIEHRDYGGSLGGRVSMDFFSKDDLRNFFEMVSSGKVSVNDVMKTIENSTAPVPESVATETISEKDDAELYSVKDFCI